MNLSHLVAHHADRRAGEPAFGYRGETVTYGELHARTERMAGVLAAAGVGRGDVFAVLLHNSLGFIDLMCAGAHLGAVLLPLNWRLAGAELEYILDHSEAKALVSEEELKPLVASMPEPPTATCLSLDGGSDHEWRSIARIWDEVEPVVAAADVEADDLHRLMYTSGTTSRPKGAMISYGNLYWKCAAQVVELGLTAADRGLACGPLYHVGALDLVTTNLLYVGGSVEIVRKFEVSAVLEAIQSDASTVLWLAPAMVNLIVADPRVGDYDLSSVRVVIDGGEKMPLPLIERVLATFPNAWFADAYGLTETVSGDTYLDKGSTREKLGSVGKPVLHTEVRIVDADDRPVGPGVVGEVCLRGPKVFQGYWRDPEATARALRGGWFHTGDLGRLDDDGYLFIVDRLKDMILSGGENVSSLEVERVVYEHDAVLEAAVVAMPHPTWNEVPAAYVVLLPGAELDDDELIDFCRERLAGYKVPKAVRFVDELPRNPSGKVLKRVLRDREAEALSG
jgi:fatty-acyl-CoA synthase